MNLLGKHAGLPICLEEIENLPEKCQSYPLSSVFIARMQDA